LPERDQATTLQAKCFDRRFVEFPEMQENHPF